MRIRKTVTAAAITLLLVACDEGTKPAETEQSTDAPPPQVLQTKLEAQTQDPCAQQPESLTPEDCRKYITQITNTAKAVRRVGEHDRALQDAANTIEEGIEKYRGNECAGTDQQQQECTTALSTAADGLRSAHDTLVTANG